MTRKQAIKDTQVIWKEIAETGETKEVIEKLFKEGKISQRSYICSCPLCESFLDGECNRCPWPDEDGDNTTRCCRNPDFERWANLEWKKTLQPETFRKEDEKKLRECAKAIYKLTLAFK